MSSDHPSAPPPGPWGQSGPAPGPLGPGQPYGYPPPPPGGYPDAGYAFGPFAPPVDTGPPGPPPGPTPPPARSRVRALVILGVVALALVLVGVGAAVLVRNRTVVGPDPVPSPGGPGTSSPSRSSAPPAPLASDAVRGYLEALAAGDADAALAYAAAAAPPGPFMTDRVLAESVRRAPITAIDVPAVNNPGATAVSASYTLGKTPVNVDYGVKRVGGAWKLSAVAKTVDLGLVRSPSIPIRINGVAVKSDSVDLLPGAYAFAPESPLLTLGNKSVMVIRDPNDFANVLDLRVGLSANGRKAVLAQAKNSYRGCLKTRVPKPKNCPFAWNDNTYRFRSGSVRWRQAGGDPFAKAKVGVLERSARVSIDLNVKISGPCTFRGSSGTCSGKVTGTGVAALRLDKSKLSVAWLL